MEICSSEHAKKIYNTASQTVYSSDCVKSFVWRYQQPFGVGCNDVSQFHPERLNSKRGLRVIRYIFVCTVGNVEEICEVSSAIRPQWDHCTEVVIRGVNLRQSHNAIQFQFLGVEFDWESVFDSKLILNWIDKKGDSIFSFLLQYALCETINWCPTCIEIQYRSRFAVETVLVVISGKTLHSRKGENKKLRGNLTHLNLLYENRNAKHKVEADVSLWLRKHKWMVYKYSLITSIWDDNRLLLELTQVIASSTKTDQKIIRSWLKKTQPKPIWQWNDSWQQQGKDWLAEVVAKSDWLPERVTTLSRLIVFRVGQGRKSERM